MCDFCNTDIKTNGTCKECGKPKCDNCASLSNPDVHIACFKQREIKHRVRQDPISPSRIRPVPRPTEPISKGGGLGGFGGTSGR